MRARLFSRYGKLGDLDFEIADEATLGRSQTNSIVLRARAISSEHARIRLDRERDRYVIEDLGSLNGTELDGVPLAGPEPLGPLHVLTIAGRYELIFQDRELCSRRFDVEEAARRTEPEEAPYPGAPPGAGDTLVEKAPLGVPEGLGERAAPGMGTMVEAVPVVLPAALGGDEVSRGATPPADEGEAEPQVVLELPEELGTHALPNVPGQNVVGRTADADISIPRPTVSRRHAVLRVGDGRVWVRDLESANRTFVDGERLEAGGERELTSGARLRFGDVEGRIHFADGGAGSPEPKDGMRDANGGTERDDG